jgi:hypothetical protein
MRAKPFQFLGRCEFCKKEMGLTKSAVAIEMEATCLWLCTACAVRLATRILKAVETAKIKTKRGMTYRDDRWMTKEQDEEYINKLRTVPGGYAGGG